MYDCSESPLPTTETDAKLVRKYGHEKKAVSKTDRYR